MAIEIRHMTNKLCVLSEQLRTLAITLHEIECRTEPPFKLRLCYSHLIPCVYSALALATSVFCSFSNFRSLFLSASALRVLQSKLKVWGTLSLALRVFLGKAVTSQYLAI